MGQVDTPRGVASTRLEAVAEGIIEAGWLVALVLAPLFFNPYSWRSFEPDKVALLQSVAALMAASWLVKVAAGGRAWRPAGADPSVSERTRRVIGIPLVAPAALVAATTLLAALLSVDRRLSWLGSYQRGHGVTFELTCIAIFLLTLGHLRSGAQWRRAVLAVVLTSVAVVLYGLLQSFGLDPIQWSSGRQRVGSSLGNPVFLGGYLVTVAFISAWALMERLGRVVEPPPKAAGAEARRHRGSVVQAAVLLYVIVLQGIALVLSQSRGPMLGMLAGGYTFLIVGSLLARQLVVDDRRYPRGMQRVLRSAWAMVLACGCAGIVLLVVVNLPRSPLAGLRGVPYVGRLGTAFDTQSRTARVRQQIWQGSYELLRSSEPLVGPDGTADALHRWRPLVGYGPETFALAFSRFESPELARTLQVPAVPDRAHNASIQRVVTAGLLGWLALMTFFWAIFYHSVRWLGLVGSAGRRWGFWVASAGGAIAGAVMPVPLTGSAVLSGVGLSAGLVLGVLAFVTASALRGSDVSGFGVREGLILAILATAVGHWVELTFGIAIVSTSLMMWFLAAVLVVAGERWMVESQRRDARQRRGGEPKARSTPPAASPTGLAVGLLTAVVLVTTAFALVANPTSATRTGEVLVGTLVGADGRGLSGVFWLLLLTWLVAASLARPGEGGQRDGSRRSGMMAFLLASVVLPSAYILVQASRLATDSRLQASSLDLVRAIDHVTWHVVAYAVVVLLLVTALGVAIATPLPAASGPPSRRLLAILAGVAAAVLVVTVTAFGMRALRADGFLRYGGVVAELGRQQTGLELLRRAAALDPLEPMHELSLGTAALASAERTAVTSARESFFATAEAAFARARQLAPLDPDHTQNLARLWAVEARQESDTARRRELLRRAWTEYQRAMAMRPASTELVVESVAVLEALGERDQAWQLAERALAMDPTATDTVLRLVSLCRSLADEARATGDRAREANLLGRAVEMLEGARSANPGSEAVARALAAMSARAGQVEPALEAYRLVLRTFGEDSPTHQTMALLEHAAGRREAALYHAQRAVELAGEEDRAEATRVLEHVSGSGVEINP